MATPRRRPRKPPGFPCPHCGAWVRRGALGCRECGSDAQTGWSPGAGGWEAGLPDGHGDDAFDYDGYLQREFPGRARRSWKFIARAAGLTLLLVALFLSLGLGC